MCPHIDSRCVSRDACEDASIGVHRVGRTFPDDSLSHKSQIDRTRRVHVTLHVIDESPARLRDQTCGSETRERFQI